jgi:NAD(P)-dependent dehydrogenase (short-subunit alcohol dehydrogenase family)
MRLKDEVAIVTGSTKNLGRGIAEKYAAEGAKVVVTGRTESLGKEVVEGIRSNGGEAFFVRCDINHEEEVKNLVQACSDQYGPCTILVNNAAPTDMTVGPDAVDGTVVNITTERFMQVFVPDLMAALWASKYAIPQMAAAGHGSIINMSSLNGGALGVAGGIAYSVAKGGMLAFTRSAAVEGAEHNIRVNCIIVGWFPRGGEDDVTFTSPETTAALMKLQLTRWGLPEDMANVCVFLGSKESEFITGVGLPVDGGALCKLHIPELGKAGWDKVAG